MAGPVALPLEGMGALPPRKLAKKPAGCLQIPTILKDQLTEDDSVLICGLGQWKVWEKKSRIGRNPKTLEKFEVTPRRVVTFYASNVWREEISNNSNPK